MENIYMINLKVIYNNGTANKTASYEVVGDEKKAKGTFHSEVGKYMKSENVAHVFAECVDIQGVNYGMVAEDVYPASATPAPQTEEA